MQVCSALHQRYPEFAAELTSKLFSICTLGATIGGVFLVQQCMCPYIIDPLGPG